MTKIAGSRSAFRIRIHTKMSWILNTAFKHFIPTPVFQEQQKTSLLAALRQQIIAHAVNDQNIIAKANNIPRYYPARKVSRVSTIGQEKITSFSVPDPPNSHVFALGLPDPDPLVRGMDPDLDPSIIKKK